MDKNSIKKFEISVNHESDTPKYQQIMNNITNAISENVLHQGDLLPSVNFICKNYGLSRDTVFKAYFLLKKQEVIQSVPNKGYYVAAETRKVLLVLDTFKAYKEVLYHSFIQNLPDNYICDVQFHHYHIDNFKSILNNAQGKYHRYIVMGFDHPEVSAAFSEIPINSLLIIDWNIHAKEKNNFVCQDFGKSFFSALELGLTSLKKYRKVVFVYPEYSDHPKETMIYFKKFVKEYNLNGMVIQDSNNFKIKSNTVYLSVSDRILGRFLEQCKEKNMEPGVDVGFLSYNETPMKKFIYKGISVISTNFKELGTKAAEFVNSDQAIQHYVGTSLILRESL